MNTFWRSLMVLAAGALLIVLGLLLVFAGDVPFEAYRGIVGLLPLIVGGGLLYIYLRSRYGGSGDPVANDETVQIDLDQIPPEINGQRKLQHCLEIPTAVETLQRGTSGRFKIAGQEISEVTVEALGKFLANSRLRHGRIVERIEFSAREIHQQVSSSLLLDFLPESNRDCLFYPVLTVRKGELQDGFRTELEGGAPVLVLTYDEYCQVMIVHVRALLARAKLPTADASDAEILINKALYLICRRQLASDNYTGAVEAVEKLGKELTNLSNKIAKDYHDIEYAAIAASPGANDDARRLAIDDEARARRSAITTIASYVQSLHDRHLVLAVLPPESTHNNRAVVKYRRKFAPQWCHSRFGEHPISFIRERVAAFFGAGLGEVEVDLRRASRAQSYHIEVRGGENAYAATQAITGIDNYEMVGHPGQKQRPRFVRLKGQSYVHWYFRDLARKHGSRDELTLHVEFFEAPPSSMAKATMSALAATVLIYVVSLVASAADGEPLNIQSDFPALVLAFPAVAAAWIGMDRSQTSLLTSDIAARFASIATFLFCVLAGALFILQNSRLATPPPIPFSLLGLRDVYWLLLSVLSFTNLLLTSAAWIGHSRRYFRMRGDEGAEVGSTEMASVSHSASMNVG